MVLPLLRVAAMAFGAVSFVLAASSADAQAPALSARDRALLDAASSEPLTVTLASLVMYSNDETTRNERAPEPSENRIVFRMPAAYIAGIRFSNPNPWNHNAPGASLLTLVFWDRSFDPVMPDRVADRAACRRGGDAYPCSVHGPANGRELQRRRAGEVPLQVQIGNHTGSATNRRYIMLSYAGLVTAAARQLQPCDFQEDAALGMLVGRTPAGPRPLSACNIFSTGMIDRRSGRFFDRAVFLMREADGSPKFGVRCPVFTGPDDGVGPSGCEAVGYFGIWPIYLSFTSNRVGEWDASFERLRAFLAQHLVSRTD